MNYNPAQRLTNRLYGRNLNPLPPPPPPLNPNAAAAVARPPAPAAPPAACTNRVGIPFRWIARGAVCLLVTLVLFVLFPRSFAYAMRVAFEGAYEGAHKAAEKDGFGLHETTRDLGQRLEALWRWAGRHFEWLLGLWLAAASLLVAVGDRRQWRYTTMKRCRAMLGIGLVALMWIGFAYATALVNWATCSRSVCVAGLTSGLSFLPPHGEWMWNRTCKAALHRAHGFAHCDKVYIASMDGSSHSFNNDSSESGGGGAHSFTEAVFSSLFGWNMPYYPSLLFTFAEATSPPPPPPHNHSSKNATAFERCSRTLHSFAMQKQSILYTSQTVEGYACFACMVAGLFTVVCNLVLRRTNRVESQCLFWTLILCFSWHALASAVLHVGATNSAESSLYKAVDHLFGVRRLMDVAAQAFTSMWGLGSGTPQDKDDKFLKDAAALIGKIPEVLHRRVQDVTDVFQIVYVLGTVAGVDDPEKAAASAAEIVVFFVSLIVAWIVVPFVLGLRNRQRRRTMRYVSIYAAYASYNILSSVGFRYALSTPWSREMNQRYESVYGTFVFAVAYAFLCACSMHRYRAGNLHSLLVLCTLLLVCSAARLAVCNGILKDFAHKQTKQCQAFSLDDEDFFGNGGGGSV